MSAIFGLIHFDHQPVDPTDLEHMHTALIRHGTNGGIWHSGAVGMGQRQMCFTPQDTWERQPLCAADDACVLVADVRLDNRAEFQLDNLPDSALILHAYQTWGIDCVHHLVGTYAFAIWDKRSRTLFVARSPIAAPNLVYTMKDQTFAFATMPSGLHALPTIPRALDEAGLVRLLTGLGGDTGTTLYRDIMQLPSGHRLLIENGQLKLDQYWHPDPTHEIHFGRDEEYLEAFVDLFERVVADHLACVTPVAMQLSGGLDSSAIGAVAARRLADRAESLIAFTEVPRAGFKDRLSYWSYADETPFVQAIAAMYPNIELSLVHTDGRIFLQDLDHMFAHLEMPFQNTSNRVWIETILAEAGRRGLCVLLDGTQGNITMSWHGAAWLADRLHKKQWGWALQQVGTLARSRGLRTAARTVIRQGISPFVPDRARQIVSRLRRQQQPPKPTWETLSPINAAFARAHGVPEVAHADNQPVRYRCAADARRVRYRALATQDGGAYLSAYRAMYGIDMRSPAADVRLAEFCIALPEDQHWRGGEARALVRRAMVGQLPTSVLANHKRGLQAADWFERLLGARPQVGAALTRIEQSDLARYVLDVEKMRRLFDHMPATIETREDYFAYFQVLQGGLMIGAFLDWFEREDSPTQFTRQPPA